MSREQKRSGQAGSVSSGVSVRVLAGDKRPTQPSVFASLRRLNEGLLCIGMGKVKGTGMLKHPDTSKSREP